MERGYRWWLGVAELGMAFAGLVVAHLLVGIGLGGLDDERSGVPVALLAGPLITALAAFFYAKVGPWWAANARPDGDEPPPTIVPWPGHRSASPPALVGLIATGVGLALGGSMAIGAGLEWVGWGVQEQPRVIEIADRARSGGVSIELATLAISAVLLAPLAEEWLFRRLLFVRVLGTSGRGLAYGLSALGFAAIHLNPTGLVIYFWLGMVFAWVIERSGRLWPAVAVHMGNNAYVLMMLVLWPPG